MILSLSSDDDAVPYPAAVAAIAAPLRDRTSIVMVALPEAVALLVKALNHFPPGWQAYLDNGGPHILVTTNTDSIRLADTLLPTIAVLTVPKTTPITLINALLHVNLPPDGSRDLVMLQTPETEMSLECPDVPAAWPIILVEVWEQLDPTIPDQIGIVLGDGTNGTSKRGMYR